MDGRRSGHREDELAPGDDRDGCDDLKRGPGERPDDLLAVLGPLFWEGPYAVLDLAPFHPCRLRPPRAGQQQKPKRRAVNVQTLVAAGFPHGFDLIVRQDTRPRAL